MPNAAQVTKTCPRCGLVTADRALHFHRNKAQSDGFSPYCKACKKATCLPRSEAQKERDRQRARARQTQRRLDDPEGVKADKKAYYQRHQTRLQKRQRRYNRLNAEKRAAYHKLVMTTDPERFRARWRKATAKRRSAPGKHTAEDVKRLLQVQEGRCFWCGCDVGSRYHVDHVQPLSKGGSNGPENLVIACPDCNQRKSDLPPSEWIKRINENF